ncbi:MAG: DUF305 domain-containing protein [Actinomycetia bacterium]|nr:DUF305 domain-containing protein [Mycobacterium sp.]MCH9732364.1 DUF305 domain-containing protein [Actinomycetes bacterium]
MDARRTLLVGVAAVAVLITVSACSNSGTQSEPSSPTAATSSSAPATNGNEATHNAADVKFVHHMIPHHQQAIEMSNMILAKSGIDPQVSDLATQIKAAQGPEIEQLQKWLTEWGMPAMSMTPGMGMPGMDMPGMGDEVPPASESPAPQPGDAPSTSAMPSESMMPGMDGMPGMAGMMSPADMDALNTAQGLEASKLFLTQMITHHEGAITMAQKEIEGGQFPAAITMAESIVASQQKEIDTMNQILSSL